MSAPETTPFIQYELGDDHVATLTLNRPEKLNGINAAMLADIKRCWQEVRDDDRYMRWCCVRPANALSAPG